MGCHQEKTFSVLSPLARHRKATEGDRHPAGYLGTEPCPGLVGGPWGLSSGAGGAKVGMGWGVPTVLPPGRLEKGLAAQNLGAGSDSVGIWGRDFCHALSVCVCVRHQQVSASPGSSLDLRQARPAGAVPDQALA